MCPKSLRAQQGFLMPLAIFIIVMMGLFALAISRNSIQSSTSVTLELVSAQALYAAESGTQRGMQTLFFPNASSRQLVDTNCVGLNTTHSFNVNGLKNCSAIVTCTCRFQDNSNCSPIDSANYSSTALPAKAISYYTVTSEATCGSGNLRAVRTIDAGAFLQQE